MSSAGWATELPLSIWKPFIVEHEEMIFEPACCIITHNCDEALCIVVLDCHEENSIVLWLLLCSSFFLKLRGPVMTIVTVVAGVTLFAPRIAQLH